MSETKGETISDFNKQWTSFKEQKGVYASEELFFSYFNGLLKKNELINKSVAEIGCGNGRFIKILSKYTKTVVGFEPSGAIEIAKEYCHKCDNVKFDKCSIYNIDQQKKFDIIFCLGVLHHLPDPIQALKKIGLILKERGVAYIWVYGKENNKLYLNFFKPLMKITSRMTHWQLNIISCILTIFLKLYIYLILFIPFLHWPMKEYIKNISKNLKFYYLKLVIYDQLNPKIANYYSRQEIIGLAKKAGFEVIDTYHRYNYSWALKLSK